jgi:hypothetical protein
MWYDGTPMELWLRGHKLKRWEERPFAPVPAEDAQSHS